jgi:hypothetical protein
MPLPLGDPTESCWTAEVCDGILIVWAKMLRSGQEGWSWVEEKWGSNGCDSLMLRLWYRWCLYREGAV